MLLPHLKIVCPGEGETTSAFGARRRILLSSADTAGQFVVCECEAPSSLESPLQVHSREDEVLFIRSGCYEFSLDGKSVEVGPGSVVYCPRDVPQSFRMADDESGLALAITWPGGSENYFRRCTQEFATGAPDFLKIVQLSNEFGISLLAPEGVEAQRAMRTVVQKPRIVTPFHWQMMEVEGTRVQRLLSERDTGGSCSLLEFVTPSPSHSLLTLPNRPEQPEIFFVHKGRYELMLDGEGLEVEAGTLVYAPTGQGKAFRALGEERGRLLLASFSSALEEVFFPAFS